MAPGKIDGENAVAPTGDDGQVESITGSPFFDKWFRCEGIEEERTSFCRKVGLDPSRPFILYLGSSENIPRDESWLVSGLATRLGGASGHGGERIGVLVRPHPANPQVYRRLRQEGLRVWPRDGRLPDSEEATRDFYNSMHHCMATVGINTSGMIDSIVNDIPCVTVVTERYATTQAQAAHFRQLLDADVLEVTTTVDECVDAVRALQQGADHRREARCRFVRSFVRPRGLNRPAGQVAARAIELLGTGLSARQIDAKLGTK